MHETNARAANAAELLPTVAPAARWFWRACLGLRRPFLRARIRRPHLEQVAGMQLLVTPQVLSPLVFRSGRFFAEWIAQSPQAELAACRTMLDMGTGSGVCAIAAARRGCRVVAVDINPHAVRCARINVLFNEVDSAVEVREGDLYAALRGERFDAVLFNPPFYCGTPGSAFDLAWRGEDVFERFVAGLPSVLNAGGAALVLLSTDGDTAAMLELMHRHRMNVTPAARRNFGNEVMTIYTVRPSSAE